jgi:hypothetical protein
VPDRMDVPSPRGDRTDIAGSLADHVRQYATGDPEVASTRDHLAALAERAGQESTPSPQPAAEASEEVWQTPPTGMHRVLAKGDGVAEYNGGLWTVTYPDSSTQQFGHGYFVATQGPFRPAPPVR